MDGTKLTNDISWFFSVYQSRTERLRRILPASVREELDEYRAELDAMESAQDEASRQASRDRAEGELGDYLFAIVNAARLYGLNPDTALERTCAKFRRRFTYLEEHTIRKGRDLKDMTLAEMDALWDEAKSKGL